MIDQIETLQADLGGIVGVEHVRPATAADAIDGVQPQLVVEPGDADQVANVLRFANESGLRIAPRGGGSKLLWGNVPAGIDLVLSLSRLNQVLEHAWGDMTVTVQAGCTVATLQRTLAEHGQRLALDPLWPATATIGGIVATNDSGALRVRFGSLRDLILGITVALPDGTLAKSGGKVVKNVAGYDLPKLMTGALGTLGVITEATFRLYPLPVDSQTWSIRAPSMAAANALLLKILDSTLVPTAARFTISDSTQPSLYVRFEGVTAALETQAQQLSAFAQAAGCESPAMTDESSLVLDRENLWNDVAVENSQITLIGKVNVLPTQWADVVAAVQRVAGPLRMGWDMVAQSVGVGLLRFSGANDQVLLVALNILRTEIVALDGSFVVLHCPLDIKQRIDVWGTPGNSLPLMRRVKDHFDPNAILNPGRYLGF